MHTHVKIVSLRTASHSTQYWEYHVTTTLSVFLNKLKKDQIQNFLKGFKANTRHNDCRWILEESGFKTEASAVMRFSGLTKMCVVRKTRRKKARKGRKEEGAEKRFYVWEEWRYTLVRVSLVHWPFFTVFLCKLFCVLKEFFTVLWVFFC